MTPKKIISTFLIVLAAMIIGRMIGERRRDIENRANTELAQSELGKFDLAQGASTSKDLITYQDDKLPFSVQYPKNWSKAEGSNPAIRLSLSNPSRKGVERFNVVGSYIPALKGMTPEDYVASIRRKPDTITEGLKSAVETLQVVQQAETKLGEQAAFLIIVDIKTKASVISRVMQIMTARDGYTYQLTFVSESDRFEAVLPTFKQIATSFTLK